MADDQIQAWIQKARSLGANDEEIRSRLRPEDQARYFPQRGAQRQGLKGPQTGQAPGFLEELYNKFVQPPIDVATGIWKNLQPSPQIQQPWLGQAMRGMVGAAQAQQHQGVQEFQQPGLGSKVLGATRATVGGLPGVGPATMDVIDAIRKGQWGKSGADMLSLASMVGGPKATEGVMAPVRAVGRDIYEDAMRFPGSQRVPRPEDMLQLGREAGVTASKSGIRKLQSIIDDSMAKAKAEVAKQPNLPVSTQKVLQDIESEYQGYHATGDEDLPQATKLYDTWEKYIDHFGNFVSLNKAQDLKAGTWKRLNEKTFQQEAAQTPGLQRALFLRGTGLKGAIEEAVGPQSPLADLNQRAHVAMGLQKQIETLDAKEMNLFTRAVPFITGAAAYAAAKAFGLPGGETLAIGGAVSSAGLASYLSRLAMHDPAVMSRLGLVMSQAGRGNLAQFVGNLPKSAVLPDTGLGTQDTKSQVPQTQSALSAASTPSMGDIPELVRNLARGQGLDPRIAIEVARQESGLRHVDENGQVIRGHDAQGNVSNARGLFQLMPNTAKDLGVDPNDLQDNAKGGVTYLGQMMDRANGDIPTALAAYHDGPTAIFDKGADVSPEGQAYVKSIMSRLEGGQ